MAKSSQAFWPDLALFCRAYLRDQLDQLFWGGETRAFEVNGSIVVPEPSSCALLVLGSIGVWAAARRRRKS